ncbi:MAG: tRNA 2-thiouridine(34) synthase MnmA [bacterium]
MMYAGAGINPVKNSRVLVAMSGGVDSSTAACLLVRQGHEVAGAHLMLPKFSSSGSGESRPALTSRETHQGAEDAQRVCRKLDIPFYAIDVRQEFQKEVVEYFCREYLAGRTPNPCIPCNRGIKFGALLDTARAMGFDFLATGHYVSLAQDPESKRFYLQRARDERKDQSYFLYTLTQAQLRHILFPLGSYTKEDIRIMAREFDLPVHDKPESQEICFLPQGDYTGFLRSRKEYQDRGSGPILNRQGEVLGSHKGIYSYTIGQRRGLGLYNPSPLYVLSIDPERNAVIVGAETETYRHELIATRMNWMLTDAPGDPLAAWAQIRYRHRPRPVIIVPLENQDDDAVLVRFQEPEKSIARGQSVVFYQGDKVLGGGVIDRVLL